MSPIERATAAAPIAPPCSRGVGAVAGDHVFTALSGGWYHTCGIDPTGSARCWGMDLYGQVGDGITDQADKYDPVAVAGDHIFATPL